MSRNLIPLRPLFTRYHLGISYNGLVFSGWISHNNVFGADGSIGKENERFAAEKDLGSQRCNSRISHNDDDDNIKNKNKNNVKPSVFGLLHAAADKFIGRNNYENLRGSSRTDAGVHALRNCFQIDVNSPGEKFNPRALVGGFNDAFYKLKFLDYVGVSDAKYVDASFDARREAVARTYMYRIINKNFRDTHSKVSTLQGNNAMIRYGDIDLDLMREAASLLVGEHDYSSFRSTVCSAKSPIRIIYSIDIISNQSNPLFQSQPTLNKDYMNAIMLVQGGDEIISIFVKGNKFLHRMVRMIVGSLVDVGTGKISIQDFKGVIDAKSIVKNPSNAAVAHGLYLVDVHYKD